MQNPPRQNSQRAREKKIFFLQESASVWSLDSSGSEQRDPHEEFKVLPRRTQSKISGSFLKMDHSSVARDTRDLRSIEGFRVCGRSAGDQEQDAAPCPGRGCWGMEARGTSSNPVGGRSPLERGGSIFRMCFSALFKSDCHAFPADRQKQASANLSYMVSGAWREGGPPGTRAEQSRSDLQHLFSCREAVKEVLCGRRKPPLLQRLEIEHPLSSVCGGLRE